MEVVAEPEPTKVVAVVRLIKLQAKAARKAEKLSFGYMTVCSMIISRALVLCFIILSTTYGK